MTPGTIFISHRAEYGRLVRELKKAIEQTSRGKIEVFISEDIPLAFFKSRAPIGHIPRDDL